MNSRNLAGISLAVMAFGFLITLFLPDRPVYFLLKGGFEAGLVGGIADWFAVTALFRHPLGLPIPHTSLLLKNRDKMIHALISAMENDLLNKVSIENKLRRLNILQTASSALTRLLAKRKARTGVVDLLTQFVQKLPLEKAVPFLQSAVSQYIRNADVKATADSILTKTMNNGYDEKALDYVLMEAAKWGERPETRIMFGKLAGEKLSQVKVGGFMGFAVQTFAGFMDEDKLGGILQNMLLSGLRDLGNRDNTYRTGILREIRVRLFQWAEDDVLFEQLKDRVIQQVEGESGEAFLNKQLEEIRRRILDKLEEERLGGGRTVFAAYRTLVRHLQKDPGWMAEWEERLLAYLLHLVESNHYRIGKLVKENLDQMDDVLLVNMLEEKVGNDLQWIRVNGALCGFVVGLVLSVIQLF